VIRSFRSRTLKRFAETGDASKLSVRNADRVRRILIRLNEAKQPEQMNAAGLKFHRLKGPNKDRWAVWATANYRITFGWAGEDAVDVDLEDYH
jgi:proteic killer suppression protein